MYSQAPGHALPSEEGDLPAATCAVISHGYLSPIFPIKWQLEDSLSWGLTWSNSGIVFFCGVWLSLFGGC